MAGNQLGRYTQWPCEKEKQEPKRFAPASVFHRKVAVVVAFATVYALYIIFTRSSVTPIHSGSSLQGYCSKIPGIPPHEFIDRQTRLVETLQALGGGSYLAEPGASAGFFSNLSGSHWHLSERPFLLLISSDDKDAHASPRINILTPSFEAIRAKTLPIASSSINWVEWPEYEDPYNVLLSSLPKPMRAMPVYVDGAVRHFVATGLSRAGADVRPAPEEIRLIRERKSPAEIEIMKCVNEATVLAIRDVRRRMSIGVRESQVRTDIAYALTSAGITNTWSLVLFGENAALPHGSGSDRTLGANDFVLIDTGGNLHGYSSDVTRTFALPESDISEEHLKIWQLVHAAQAAAFAAAANGTVAYKVDEAARATIEAAGYGKYFTHRLGHGIGLETHEDPYLVGGSQAVLAPGHSFSDEPGVYIEGKIGVRLEDCFYIAEDGKPRYLTERVGGAARSPWEL